MRRNASLSGVSQLTKFHTPFIQRFLFTSPDRLEIEVPSSPENVDAPYADVPKPRRDKSERKPYPTAMKSLIKKAKEEKELRKAQPCRLLEHPPANGLLVPELVDVAHRLYRSRGSLLSGLSQLLPVVPIQRCRFCSEVHVGHVGHEIRTCSGLGSGSRSATHIWKKGAVSDVVFFPRCFHLYDRVGKPRILHEERYTIKRVPAIVELCIQAGLDLVKLPTKRRTKPVYSIEGRIVDFESTAGEDGNGVKFSNECGIDSEEDDSLKTLFGERNGHGDGDNLREVGMKTMESWFEMLHGAKKIMEKYAVWTCGYCPEVQVGPRGHKVRMCKASKHQSRNGLHAWQEATIDDLVGPNYVWHVRDLNGPPLHNGLKRFYGKAPAVVELCIQAGAPVPDQYRSMMRLDVVPPERDEVDLVA